MSIPTPEPGLVIRYTYLWRHEHNRGQDEGSKDRPCVIMLVEEPSKDSIVRVTVAAVTHTPPDAGSFALEMPAKVKQHLGLDDQRSWLVLDEVNQFDWPGYDLRLVPGRDEAYTYGFIPPALYEAAKVKLLEANSQRKVAITPRD